MFRSNLKTNMWVETIKQKSYCCIYMLFYDCMYLLYKKYIDIVWEHLKIEWEHLYL